MILACISFPQLVLSQLKCLHSALSPLATIQSYPSLPTLLAVLKSNAVTGLPGQTKVVATIQPPLSIPPALLPTQHQSSSTKQKPQSVAGPQGRKKQHKNKSREKGTSSSSVSSEKKDKSGGLTPDHSSDSDTASSSSASSLTSSVGRKERVRRLPLGNESPHYTSSDSELSDSEPAPNRLKLANGKIRYQAHSCLTLIFQVISLFPSLSLSLSHTHTHAHTHSCLPLWHLSVKSATQLVSATPSNQLFSSFYRSLQKLDRQTSFTYWRSFLPDCPRLPNSPPSLLTCIIKDPTPKVSSVVMALIYLTNLTCTELI